MDGSIILKKHHSWIAKRESQLAHYAEFHFTQVVRFNIPERKLMASWVGCFFVRFHCRCSALKLLVTKYWAVGGTSNVFELPAS